MNKNINKENKRSIFKASELSDLNYSLEEIEQLRSEAGDNTPIKNWGLEKEHRKKL
ncbi:hypothetical protein HON22_03545, partial [Candidatus Peregrinibacteria bacterium]|nr:hypothetical protein [Candidatus Peregrinibacteria bacterium]